MGADLDGLPGRALGSVYGLGVLGCGFRGLGFRVHGLGDLGCGLWVWGLGFWV